MWRSERRVSRSPAQAFSAEVGEEHVVVLRGQGGVERPDASWRKNLSGFAAHDRLTLAVLAQLGFLARRRQCLRAVTWPQHVERNEGEGCSVRACREPLRVRSSRVCRRGSVITFRPPARSLGQPITEGRTGLPIGFYRPAPCPQTDCGWLGSRPGPEASCAGERRRGKRTTPRKREPLRRRGAATGFRRATPGHR